MVATLFKSWTFPTRAYGEVPVRLEQASRFKSMRLSAGRKGVIITAPPHILEAEVLAYLSQNQSWVVQTLHKMGGLEPDVAPFVPLAPATLLWAGTPRAVRWVEAEYPSLVITLDELVFHGPWEKAAAKGVGIARGLLRSAMEQLIQKTLSQRVPEFAKILGRAPLAYQIKSSKTWWGRLTGQDKMALDVSLAFAGPEILEYVVAHEMGHLIEKNHSARFWAQVARLDLNYRVHDRWLDQKGGDVRRQKHWVFGET